MISKSTKVGLVFLAGLMIAVPALANESTYSFEMDYRYVEGKKNGVTHSLDHGILTIAGQLWVTRCDTGTIRPQPVKIEVWEDVFLEHAICSFVVLPSKKIGEKVSFSTTCASVPTARFFVVAWKEDDDGCDIQATGALTTK